MFYSPVNPATALVKAHIPYWDYALAGFTVLQL